MSLTRGLVTVEAKPGKEPGKESIDSDRTSASAYGQNKPSQHANDGSAKTNCQMYTL